MIKRGITWSWIFVFFGTGVLLTVYSFAVLQPNWSPPSKSDLTIVKGEFVTLQKGPFQPYQFKTEGGETIRLGCWPEVRVVDCLLHIADSPELSGPVTIGYMKVHTPWWEFRRAGWPNVLVTINSTDKPILTFSKSRAEFENSYAFEQKSKWMIPIFLLPFAAGCLYVGIGAGIKKAKREI